MGPTSSLMKESMELRGPEIDQRERKKERPKEGEIVRHISQTQTDRQAYEQTVRPIDRLTNKQTNRVLDKYHRN